MAGIYNDTANTGYGGGYNYGGGGYYGNCGSNWTDLAALAMVTGGFGFGGRHHDGHNDYGKGYCCAPATCEQVNDVDRDVIRCANDVDRDVLTTGFGIQKDVWDVDRDVLLSARDIKDELCKVQHHLEKDIWGVDRDVLMGFKDTDHKIDMVKCEMKEGFAEVKGIIKETARCQELREKDAENRSLARRLEEAKDTILKKDVVAEILAALHKTPVI